METGEEGRTYQLEVWSIFYNSMSILEHCFRINKRSHKKCVLNREDPMHTLEISDSVFENFSNLKNMYPNKYFVYNLQLELLNYSNSLYMSYLE